MSDPLAINDCPWCKSGENIKLSVRERQYHWGKRYACVKCKCGRKGPYVEAERRFGVGSQRVADAEAKAEAVKGWNKPIKNPTKNDERWAITVSAHTNRRGDWPSGYEYYHTVKGDTLEEAIQLAREKLSELADEEAWLGVEQIYEARLDCITERLEAA